MSELFENETNTPGFWERNATGLAAVVANLLIIVGEVRVYDFVHRATGSMGLSLLAALTVGLPFLLWELLWKQRLANRHQERLSFVMGSVSLVIAVGVGVADYIVAGDGTRTLEQIAQPVLLGTVAFMLSAHAVALLAYVLIDDNIKAARYTARENARVAKKQADLERAKGLLAKRKDVAQAQQVLVDLYGEDVGRQLAELEGRRYEAAANPTPPPTSRK